MKKVIGAIATLMIIFVINSCSSDSCSSSNSEWACGTYNGHQLYTGPQGGCYYYNSNNNKTYVDRSNCSCN